MDIREIDKKNIYYDPENPRSKTEFNDKDIDSLKESIEKYGQLEPILAEQISKDKYIVTEGHRRLASINKSNNIKVVKVIVENKLSTEDKLLKQILIDTHRKNFNLIDRDRAWKKLWDMGNYTVASFAKKLSIESNTSISFVDRMNLGAAFIDKISNVSAYNITETKRIKDKDVRKKVLLHAHKAELTRKDIRELSSMTEKVSSEVLKEVFEEKISINDAKNMIGLDKDKQAQALITMKGLNNHKKNLKKMLKSGEIKTEDDKHLRMIADLINDFQTEFFKTASQVRQLSSKLKYMKEKDLEKYANTQMVKILESCLEELEDAVMPAMTQIKQSIKGFKVKQLEAK